MAHILDPQALCSKWPPPDYQQPSFPGLHWPPRDPEHALYSLSDSWRFTLLWTLILYALFHFGAVGVALLMHIGRPRVAWKFLWAVPAVYAIVAGFEALFAGSVVGLVVGAVYISGCYEISTWIPFIWGWINVLILIISSFTIQGGL
ncbi:hypothetical protein Micbo1qcDRAFT_173528 [Microdochium bolleyi]|uniref:Integral membrane protein n=1 Tax=Microdochium bolleyi TaxID=196109 RepID=A0A136JC67_9PEZI|nr:hypothetical protein Micbo1qcDRAFT_173528 [Microdochium bolleyi]